MTTTSLDVEATPDPGAIDLEAIKRSLYGYGNHIAVQQLIAAVEAQRARVAELEKNWNASFQAGVFHQKRADATEARVAVADGNIKCLIEANKHWHLRINQMITDAEAVEARVVEMTGALEMAAEHCAMLVRPTNEEEALAENIRTVLAAMPERMIKRAKALEEALKWARRCCDVTNWVKAERRGR